MTNVHSIPVLSEVRIVKSWHPHVHEGTVGLVESHHEDGYAVNVPTSESKPGKVTGITRGQRCSFTRMK